MTKLLQDWVTLQADRRPEALAVVAGRESMTYGQLEEASNRLAQLLRQSGCEPGDRVCLAIPKSPAAIVAIVGILKAGCMYVPLDILSPAARVSNIVASCESRLILGGRQASHLLDELLSEERFKTCLAVGWLDGAEDDGRRDRCAFSVEDLKNCSSDRLACHSSPSAPAHILFTSGSTGMPKGVVITHSSVIHFVEWAVKYFGIGSADRISGHPPLQFDMSTFDIFGCFAAGAQLHLVPPELNLLPHKLAEFIRAHELTQWFSVPSILNHMARYDVIKSHDFPRLKRLIWAGEVFPTRSLIYWMKRLPHVAFTNLYGPTETTISSSYYTVPECPEDEAAAVPIGKACEGEELLVLDEALQRVPPGVVGDLYIRGVGLSPGYWRDPEKTLAAFVPYPHGTGPEDRIYKTGDLARIGEDGLVYFLGRRDAQIKRRGYRIELGEIESALNALGILQECAVVAIGTESFEGTIICCAYVPGAENAVTDMWLRQELGKKVPRYMLPSQWLALKQLPQNANGKCDRRALQERFRQDETQAN
jgi:amino acid adenylation domain-containing protein